MQALSQQQQQQQQLYSFYKNTEVEQFTPQIPGKLVVAGQDKYINNTLFSKNKTL